MTAVRREFHFKSRISCGNPAYLVENLTRKKRIIDRTEKESPHPDLRKPPDRARACVVVLRVAKPVHRSGEDVIKGVESIRAGENVSRWKIFEPLLPGDRLSSEGLEKTSLVYLCKPAVDMA
jgi:hypothetical protein